MYYFLNWVWYDNLNDRYIHTDNQTVICLLVGIKKADLFKTQAASHKYSKYEKRGYPRANKANV